MSLPNEFKAWEFASAGKPLTPTTRPLQKPKRGEVLIKVLATGVCASDMGVQSGAFGPLPRVPGHETIGEIVAIGEDEPRWKVGDRVGAPWHGGHCTICDQCVRGQFVTCRNQEINGVTKDGGYAEYMLLKSNSVVDVPKDMDPAQYAPILCAGITVFNSLRNLKLLSGSTVAVQGIGGLGHLAVQFSRKMGFKTLAISRGGGGDKEKFAKQLGAHTMVDTSMSEDVAKALKEATGGIGVDCIICTAPNPESITPLIYGLAPRGHLLVLTPTGPVPFDTVALILSGLTVHGWPSGTAVDSEDALAFAKDNGVECMVERFPFAEADKAYERLVSGKARFRCVLVNDA